MDQPHDPPAPIRDVDAEKQIERLRRHGPVSCVGVPRRSYGYAFVAPPWIRGRGVRNAARWGLSAAS